jgi:hypothetical protein
MILTDSQAALSTIVRLQNGEPPRSRIETNTLKLLRERRKEGHRTIVGWVRSHIGIPGNKAADTIAKAHARRPRPRNTQPITHEGLRAEAERRARAGKHQRGYGRNRLKWDRTSLGAYTQLRTEKGHFGTWLLKTGRTEN